MIHRISDSVEITYSFRGNKDGKHAVPAHYCLCINTGRDSFEGPQTPVPDIEEITNLVEAYRYEFTQLLHGLPDRSVELRHSIERKLLNYFPDLRVHDVWLQGPLLRRSE
jgi:hypothetical protein